MHSSYVETKGCHFLFYGVIIKNIEQKMAAFIYIY